MEDKRCGSSVRSEDFDDPAEDTMQLEQMRQQPLSLPVHRLTTPVKIEIRPPSSSPPKAYHRPEKVLIAESLSGIDQPISRDSQKKIPDKTGAFSEHQKSDESHSLGDQCSHRELETKKVEEKEDSDFEVEIHSDPSLNLRVAPEPGNLFEQNQETEPTQVLPPENPSPKQTISKEYSPAAMEFDFGAVPDLCVQNDSSSLQPPDKLLEPQTGEMTQLPEATPFNRSGVTPVDTWEPASNSVIANEQGTVELELLKNPNPCSVYSLGTKKTLLRNLRNLQQVNMTVRSFKLRTQESSEPRESLWSNFLRRFTRKNAFGNPIVCCSKLSNCSRFVAFGLNNGDIVVLTLDPTKGSLISQTNIVHLRSQEPQTILLMAWSTESTYIGISTSNNIIFIWDVAKKSVFKSFQNLRDSTIMCMTFHPKEKELMAMGTIDRMIQVNRIDRDDTEDWVQTADVPSAIQFSPSGNRLVVGFFNGSYAIYKYEGRIMILHTGDIFKDFVANVKNQDSVKTMMAGAVKQKSKSIWNIIFAKDETELFIKQIKFVNEEEFLIMNNKNALKLISAQEGTTLQVYSNFSLDSELKSLDFFDDRVMMINGLGRVHVWRKISNYVPVFNRRSFPTSKLLNTSIEIFEVFSDFSSQFRSAAFLDHRIVSEWNRENSSDSARFILFSVSENLRFSLDYQAV